MPRRPSALIPCIGAVLVIATGCSKNPEAARRELIRSGDTYASSGKYAEAMVQYRGAVQKDGRSGEARLKLAETYMKLGDGQKAFNEYVRAADLLPSDVQTQLKAASMLLAAQQFVDAQHRADQALSLYPRNIEALLLRASALAGLQRTDEALGEAQKAIGADPARGEGYTTVGVIRLLRGEKAQAEQAFQKAIDISPRSVPARIALANFYWASGDRDRSIEQLKKILEIEPRNVQVNRTLAGIAIGTGHEGDAEGYLKASAVDDQGQLTLADFYARTARDNEARTILEKLAVPGGSAYAAATIGLATLVQRHGDQAAAGRILDNALAHAANDPDLLVAKSNWFAATGKLGEGLSLAQRAAQIAPGSASAQYTLGMLRQQHGEQTEAIKAYTEALRLNPSLVAAQVQLAQLHLRAGHLDDALQFALTAVKAAPAAADASLTLSRVYLARHDVANAEPLLKRLTQATANAPAVLAAVGEMERQKKNAPAAREALERAYAANHDYSVLQSLLMLDAESGDKQAAVRRIEAALSADPGNASLLILAAQTHIAANEISKAESDLQQVIVLDPSRNEAYGLLAGLYTASGRTSEAIFELDKLSAKQPKLVGVHVLKGMLFENQRRREDAKQSYLQALTLDAHSPIAANNLAWLYAEGNEKLDEALELARNAKSQRPDSPDIADTLGWVLYKKGLFDLAIGALRDVAQAHPERGDIQYHLGLAYLKNGDTVQARDALQKALSGQLPPSQAAEVRTALKQIGG